MAEFVLVVLTQNEIVAGKTKVFVPGHSTIAPVAVPLLRGIRVAEEFDFHLLELARAEREIPRRDFVAKTLADLSDSKGNLHAAAVADVFEIHKDALSRLRPQKCRVIICAERTDNRLEHQIELTRSGKRAGFLDVRGDGIRKVVGRKRVERRQAAVPLDLVRVFFLEAKHAERCRDDSLFRILGHRRDVEFFI